MCMHNITEPRNSCQTWPNLYLPSTFLSPSFPWIPHCHTIVSREAIKIFKTFNKDAGEDVKEGSKIIWNVNY